MPFILGILSVLIDQITKFFAEKYLPLLEGASYNIIEGVFSFTYAKNEGAAWSMMSGKPILLAIITIFFVALLIFVIVKYYKQMHTLMKYSLILILAGAIGNLIDRVFLGYVRDMFYFSLINFPIFNVADASISIGTALLIIDILFLKGRRFFMDDKKDKGESNDND